MAQITLKEINRLALPAIIAGIAEPLIGLADTAIIGHLGTPEQAGVGIGTSFYSLMIWVLAQTKSAISAIVSRYYGSGELDKVKTLVPQSIALNTLLGAVVYLATMPFARELFTLYEAKGSVLDFSTNYYTIRAIGFPVTLATFGIFGVFRGMQNTSWAMRISIIGGTVNILLDLLLVYGWDPYIPSYGVQGAAWASLIAQGVMLLLALGFLFRKTDFRLRFGKTLNPEIPNLLKLSGNLIVRTLALNVAYFLGLRYATGYGENHSAAHSIVMNIWLFSAFAIDGYASAGNAISGRLLGAKDFSALRQLAKDVTKISILVSVILALVFLGTYPWIGSWFNPDPAVVLLFNSVFWMFIISQPVNGVAFAFDGIFKGLGKAAWLRNTLIISTFVGFVPTVLLGDYFGWELYGVWAAFFVFMIFRAALLVWKFLRDFRNK